MRNLLVALVVALVVALHLLILVTLTGIERLDVARVATSSGIPSTILPYGLESEEDGAGVAAWLMDPIVIESPARGEF